MTLLNVEHLSVGVRRASAPILRDVSLEVDAGEIVGLVGESGSGKSMASYAIMGILPAGVEQTGGTVTMAGKDLTASRRRSVDGRIAMIFQNPKGALNPLMRVGDQVARMVRVHQGMDRRAATAEALALLRRVGIPGADRVARAYSHQLSGGMCQRIMISMALACRPRLLIADEPTTALDVTVQAQIFTLIRELVDETGCGVLFITHDLGAVAEMCDRTVVLYGGQVMEQAPTVELFEQPVHPYTRYLFDAADREIDLSADHGAVDLTAPGCRLAARCEFASPACAVVPPLAPIGDRREIACHHPEGAERGAA
ncbi:ABC transporter ATP-binding protein [Dactylosporangium sp. NPDC000521]|uniref:ABC transporter ATP-binding protein n=1 Tax=Dactylosporangium sp. NPDC000521 TaxID=3363975 RepID=UPI003679CB59